jgi:2,3-bisphosphoglycerate-dependent phosphoglycerate mutase
VTPGTLILLRHGQSQANADGLFTGLLDVPLTPAGRVEAVHAAELLNDAGLSPSTWFCSPLRRARQTADILRSRMRRPPEHVEHDWRLAERNYGALTGRTKRSVLAEHGEALFRAWRRSVDTAPPPMSAAQQATVYAGGLGESSAQLGATESLRDVIGRVGQLWRDGIAPAVLAGEPVLVIAHGNSLRALAAILDDLDDGALESLNIPTGHPLVYRLDAQSRPVDPGGRYLEPDAAAAAADAIAHEGGT